LKNILAFFLFIFLFSCSSNQVILPDNPIGSSIQKDDSTDISVITYNIKALGEKSKEEVKAITSYLNKEEFDIVLLQEVFDEDIRTELIGQLSEKYPAMMTRVDYGGWHSLWQDAGLMICSKYKCVDLSKLDLPNDIKNKGVYIHKRLNKQLSITLDAFANKSIAGMLLDMEDGNMILALTTHAQAFGSGNHKLKQLTEMKEFTEHVVSEIVNRKICKPENLAVMMTGDFNINAYSPSDHEKLLSYLGKPVDLYQNYDPKARDFSFVAGIFNVLFRFDYIFTWDKIADLNMRSIRSENIKISDIQVDSVSVSDHYPLISVLKAN